MTTSYKNPPALDEDKSYETWKSEIDIWRLMTDVEKERQALALVLSLSGQARQRALEIEVADLNKADGVDTLLESLEELFLKDKIDLAYETYSKFEQFKKTDSMSMTEYIVEYERLYTRCKRYDMTLPDAVLSFRLLDNSKLTLEQRQLALTAAKDLKFETMKTALKQIFTDIPKSCFTTPGACINIDKSGKQQEYAYYTRESSSKHKKTYQSNKLNPLNKYGKPSRCVICQSIYHWKKDCPHQVERTKKVNLTEHVEENESEECHITLFTKTLPTSEYDIFMVEAYGAAILDTACSKTVCGQSWLDNYVENISDSDKS